VKAKKKPAGQKQPRNLQKLPTGKKKHQLDKTISPDMEEADKFQVGFLGALAPYNFLFVALNQYYRREYSGSELEIKKAMQGLWELLFSAIHARDASFFEALAQLLPLADVGRDSYGVSPVVVWIMHFWEWHEDGAFQEVFPHWPPSISELQKALGKFGVEADHKTIREKVKLLGYSVRPKGPGRK
jgi:hypothetical protein